VVSDENLYDHLLDACRKAPEAEKTDHKILTEEYSAPFLPDGVYTVRAKLSNFKTGLEQQGQYTALQSIDLSIPFEP
jgi:hypothetical protein